MWLAASSFAVPDGVLATLATAQLNGKPHQGVPAKTLASPPGIGECNSTAAIGLRASLALNRLRQSERARYYGSALGRFTSPDEFKGGFDNLDGQAAFAAGPIPYADISDPQTLNKYVYVRNNPLRYIDPNGHCIEDLCIGEGALVYAGYTALAGATAAYLASPSGQQSVNAVGQLIQAGVNGIHSLITQASSNQQESGKTDEKTTKQNGAITEPNTPGKVVADQDGVKVTNNYKSDDHGPAHVHVDGQGESTKVGMNGKPLDGSPELSSKQQKVVDQNKAAIRKAVDQIQRYKKYNDQ